MRMKVNPIDTTFEIDSFKWRTLSDNVELNDSMISDYIIIHKGTGEVLPKAYKRNAYIHIQDGIKFYFALELIKTSFDKTELFLSILITSKILKEKYLQGITQKNIRDIYDALMKCNVASFSFETFLSGFVVDIDFKFDSYVDSFLPIVKACKEGAKQEHVKSGNIITYEKKNNQGIQFSKRESTNIDTKPFLKVYNKECDLICNPDNKEFYNKYLIDQVKKLSGRIRIEFTIKNKKHLRKYGIEDSSLKNILSLSRKKKNEMYLDTLSKYFEMDKPKPIKIKSVISPTNSVFITSMDYMIQGERFDKQSLIEFLIDNIKNKVAKSRKKKELESLFDTHLSKRHSDIIKKVSNRNNALGLLGIPYSRL